MSVVLIVLLLIALSKNRLVNSQLICANDTSSLNEKRICFDLDKGRFINPKIGRNSVYDLEHVHAVATISIVAARRNTKLIWEGWSAATPDVPCALQNTYIRAVRSATPTDFSIVESVFCPAVETCSCPWKAGYGIWDSCRKQINSRCYDVNATKSRKSKMKHRRKEPLQLTNGH
uniref:NTR domain-containing protein n=1 Tax=Elaeophora elaphi TaxID=1147741 RepID=A0A0R3RRI4_9BILA